MGIVVRVRGMSGTGIGVTGRVMGVDRTLGVTRGLSGTPSRATATGPRVVKPTKIGTATAAGADRATS